MKVLKPNTKKVILTMSYPYINDQKLTTVSLFKRRNDSK